MIERTTEVAVNPEESALVVIDMQKDFCYADCALFMGDAIEEIIPRISGLIEKAAQKKDAFDIHAGLAFA